LIDFQIYYTAVKQACLFMGKSFLIVVGALSNWAEVVKMARTTTAQTIVVLRNLFSQTKSQNSWQTNSQNPWQTNSQNSRQTNS